MAEFGNFTGDVVRFNVEGANKLVTLMKKLGPEVASKIGDQAVRAGARVVLKEARLRVPVRTGRLRDDMTVRIIRKPRNATKRIALVGWKTSVGRRAHLTEFGTSKSAAKPFLFPAIDAKSSEVVETYAKTLARGIARESEKLAR